MLTKLCFFDCQLKGFEIIRALHLEPIPFDMDRGLLTPTYKKKRPQMLKYYQVSCDILFHLSIFMWYKGDSYVPVSD